MHFLMEQNAMHSFVGLCPIAVAHRPVLEYLVSTDSHWHCKAEPGKTNRNNLKNKGTSVEIPHSAKEKTTAHVRCYIPRQVLKKRIRPFILLSPALFSMLKISLTGEEGLCVLKILLNQLLPGYLQGSWTLFPYITALRGGCLFSDKILCHLRRKILCFGDAAHFIRKKPCTIININLGGTHSNCCITYK